MFYDVRRLGGPVAALLAVTAGLACCGLAMRAALGQAAPWITLRAQTFNVTIQPDVALRRILSLKRDLDSGDGHAPGGRLGILIGSSTLKQGIDPAILDAEAGGGYRWTRLDCGQAEEDALVVRIMYQSGLKPSALGLVVNPGILVADGDREAERGWYDPAPFVKYLGQFKLELARTELVSLTLVPWHLAFPYRGQVFTMVDRGLFRAKLALLESLGQGPEALVAPEVDPWLNPYPGNGDRGTPDPSQVANAKVLKFIGIKGWYDPASYRADGPNFAALVELFRAAHEQKARTLLIFVPESSFYRARLPDSAADAVRHALGDALGDAAPVVLDFRNSAPDEDFSDVNHLNRWGQERFSHRLAEALKPILGN